MESRLSISCSVEILVGIVVTQEQAGPYRQSGKQYTNPLHLTVPNSTSQKNQGHKRPFQGSCAWHRVRVVPGTEVTRGHQKLDNQTAAGCAAGMPIKSQKDSLCQPSVHTHAASSNTELRAPRTWVLQLGLVLPTTPRTLPLKGPRWTHQRAAAWALSMQAPASRNA